MAKLRCEKISDGLRASQAVVTLRDYANRRHFIRLRWPVLHSGADKADVNTIRPRQS